MNKKTDKEPTYKATCILFILLSLPLFIVACYLGSQLPFVIFA